MRRFASSGLYIRTDSLGLLREEGASPLYPAAASPRTILTELMQNEKNFVKRSLTCYLLLIINAE